MSLRTVRITSRTSRCLIVRYSLSYESSSHLWHFRFPQHSINAGKVVVSGPDIPGYGNLVMISHPDGYLSLYAHCEKIFVQTGDHVNKGSMIAQLGNSEAAYPMLKFQLRKDGKPLHADKVKLFFTGI